MSDSFRNTDDRRADDLDETVALLSPLPLLISAPSDEIVQRVARRVHAGGRTPAGPLVEAYAGELPEDPERFDGQWNNLVHRAIGGSLLVLQIETTPRSIQEILAGALAANVPVERRPHVRLIVGTTVPLFDRVLDGEFSETLFYRLNAIHLVVTA
jgi:DNA-binding NtrC family response regulator